MKIVKYAAITQLLLFCVLPNGGFAQNKIAQTGFQFLSVGTDARATAMAEAVTTIEGSPMSMFYNPAGMAWMNSSIEFVANHTPWIADIDYFTGAIAFSLQQGRYGVVGLSFLYVDYGNIIGTVVASNEQGFIETGDISPNAFMFGASYARALSDKFSVGGQVKFVRQSLGEPLVPETDSTQSRIDFSTSVIAFDFGTLYRTGFKSLTFGMSIRNFAQETNFAREDFELPLTFKVGLSMDAFDFLGVRPESQAFLISVDAINPRSFQEFVSIGGEYKFYNTLALRGGYAANQDDYGFSAGMGIDARNVVVDYSYTPFDILDDVHRFSIRLTF